MAIHPAVAKAQADLARAYEVTDAKYHHFISEIPNQVRTGGSRENPQREWVKNPYMTVDGRLTMFNDEMNRQQLRYSIDAEPIHFGEHPAIKASITIYYEHGTSTVSGLSSINFGGSGVDRTNPIENADTSALGRALGKLGYGLFGYGIASADEVEDAKSRQASLPPTDIPAEQSTSPIPDGLALGKTQKPPTERPNAMTKPPSERQRSFLRRLFEQLGTSEADVLANLNAIATAQEASEMIDTLQEQLKVSEQPPKAKSQKIKAVTALLALVNERSLHTYTEGMKLQEMEEDEAKALTALLAYAHDRNMLERFKGLRLDKMSVETLEEMHTSMRTEISERFATEDLTTNREPWSERFDEADAEANAQEKSPV